MPKSDVKWTDAISVEPVGEPVSIEELKSYARIDHNDDDDHLDRQITAARKWCERYTSRAFLNQTRTATADRFPKYGEPISRFMFGPLLTVSSITYTDDDGNTGQVLSNTKYQVDTLSDEPRIVREPDVDWPTTETNRINAVVVIYTAGYGTDCSDVPPEIREAILLMASNINAGCSEMDAADDQVKELLYSFKVWKY